MNIFLFAGDSFLPLAQSLKRYFRYLFKTELGLQDGYIPGEADKIDLLFAFDEPSELEKSFTWIHQNRINPDRLRILGYDSNADISLLEVESLKTQIEHSFVISQGKDRLYNPLISNRIKLFFKGHGEQSLLGCLGWVNYYLGNYPAMAGSGQYSPAGLNETFLSPGIQNWQEFTRRFSKYSPFLYASGWDKQTNEIEQLIKVVSLDINRLEFPNSFHTFDSETFESLAEITSILEEMALRAEQYNHETNPADHR